MENKSTEIVKKDENISLGRQSFIDRMIEKSASFEDIKKVGEAIINSGFCPAHFKESKDAVGVVMCIEAGQQLGLSWMQSLSNLYPVKGMIGIMGDGAKALIVSNSLCEYWIEDTKGTYPNDDYKHIIRSKRKGLKDEYYSEFSVWDAKQAGLFNKDMYKKWGKRMVGYRNIGFHARDKWADIMKGFKTKEELEDYDETITITTPTGQVITTTDSKQSDLKSKSKETTSSVVDSIQKKKEMLNAREPESENITVENVHESHKTSQTEKVVLEEKKRGRPPKSEIIDSNSEKPSTAYPQKESTKVSKQILNDTKTGAETDDNKKVNSDTTQERKSSEQTENSPKQDDFIIPELQFTRVGEDGERLFGDVQRLFFWLSDQGMDEKKYKDSVIELLQISEKYSTMEELCKKGTVEEIQRVLEKYKELK